VWRSTVGPVLPASEWEQRLLEAGEYDDIELAALRRVASGRDDSTPNLHERDAKKRTKNRRRPSDETHRLAECALRDHVSLGRWLRQTTSGRLVIPDLSVEDVALGYKNLLEAERGFRDLKSTLDLRPVYHRIEPRIRAHVLLCWLALLLIRVAERRTA